MTNFKQLKIYLYMGEILNSEQKVRRFKFLVLQGYQLQMVADAKRRRPTFIMYAKESLSLNSSMFKVHHLPHFLQCPIFTPLDYIVKDWLNIG